MQFIEDKKDFSRRLKLFLVGVFIGSLVMYFGVFKGRDVWKSPQDVIIGKINRYSFEIDSLAYSQIEKHKFTKEQIQEVIDNADVNYSESEVRKKPCPVYKIYNDNKHGKINSIIMEVCETSNVLKSIELR